MKPGFHKPGYSQTVKVYASRLNKAPEFSNPEASYGQTTCVPASGMNPGDRINPTNWYYKVDHYVRFMGQYEERWPVGVLNNTVSGVVGGPPNSWDNWDRTALFNQALSRLNAKARDATDWSETAAQANQVRRLGNLLKTAEELAKKSAKDWWDYASPKNNSGRKARAVGKRSRRAKRKEKKVRDLIDRASSGWLQFQYGWLPLCGDIYNTALKILESNDNGLIVIRAGATQPIAEDKLVVNTGMITAAKAIRQVVTGKQGCRMKVILQAKNGPRVDDFTTLNPFLLGWNLIPYSFVVDWFYDVGGYLEALETAFLMNGQFRSGYYTEINSWFLKETLNDHVPPNVPNFTIKYASAKRRHVEFKRSRFLAWPFQNKPTLKVDLGSERMLSAAALLGAILGRK